MSSKIARFWLGWGATLAVLLLLVAWGLAQWNLQNVTKIVSDRLVLLSELRKGAVQEYFSTAEAELRFWSINPDILSAQDAFSQLWEGDVEGALGNELQHLYSKQNPNKVGEFNKLDDAGDGSRYSALHGLLHPVAKLFVTQRGYYDFFLIGPEGDVYYTVEKEADFAANLVQGQWRDSALAGVFNHAMQERKEGTIAISDVEQYGPSGDAAAIFMATALTGPAGEFLGVIAFQLPTDKIMDIMNYDSGMGETGETYLVGQDKLMRSDSRFLVESTVLSQRVDTPSVALALAGEQGVRYIEDYRGVEVMSAYTALDVGNRRWAVMAEIDRQEVESMAVAERPKMAGILAFIYALSLWSVWYGRGRELSTEGIEVADIDFAGTDSSGLDS